MLVCWKFSFCFNYPRMSQYVSDSTTATQLVCLLVPFIQQSVLKSQVRLCPCEWCVYFAVFVHCRILSCTLYKALSDFFIQFKMLSHLSGEGF